MADPDRAEIDLVTLRSRVEALEYLLALAVVLLARDEKSLEAILREVPDAEGVRAAGVIVRSAFPPSQIELNGFAQVLENATAGVFGKFKRNVRRLCASF